MFGTSPQCDNFVNINPRKDLNIPFKCSSSPTALFI